MFLEPYSRVVHRLLRTDLGGVAEHATTSGEVKGSVPEIEIGPVRTRKTEAGP